MKEWKDISSYSRSDKERIPYTFVVNYGHVRLVVTRHIHYPPDAWVMQCEQVGVFRQLTSKVLTEAQSQAKAIVQIKLEEALKELTS